MKLYDHVKQLLEQYEPLRNDDAKLQWAVWNTMGLTDNGSISKDNFYKAPASESITRCRRKIQETHEHLQASEPVRKARQEKAESKGKQLYQERVRVPFAQHVRFEDGIAIRCSCQIGEDHDSI